MQPVGVSQRLYSAFQELCNGAMKTLSHCLQFIKNHRECATCILAGKMQRYTNTL